MHKKWTKNEFHLRFDTNYLTPMKFKGRPVKLTSRGL